MIKQYCTLPLCEIITDINFSTAKNGSKMASFRFRYDGHSLYAFCFDDGKDQDVYNRLKNVLKLSKGSYVSMQCQLDYFKKNLVSDAEWESFNTGRSNPTGCYVPQYRVLAIDYGIPIEIHNKLKENEKTIHREPIGNFERFGEEGQLCMQ